MFVLSKLIGALLNPLIWVGISLIGAIMFSEKRKSFIKISLGIYLFFSIPFFSNWMLARLEYEPVNITADQSFDAGILLTGMTSGKVDQTGIHFESGADRFIETVSLYQKGIIQKIIITGGSGLMNDASYSESPYLRDIAMLFHVPDSAIIIEKQSRNTYENAKFTKPIVDSLKSKNLLLITSAFHMPRSIACFQKQNMNTIPYPTDFRAEKLEVSFYSFFPSLGSFAKWETMLHEWFGMAYYKLSGYI